MPSCSSKLKSDAAEYEAPKGRRSRGKKRRGNEREKEKVGGVVGRDRGKVMYL
jgi:hypothetical protein